MKIIETITKYKEITNSMKRILLAIVSVSTCFFAGVSPLRVSAEMKNCGYIDYTDRNLNPFVKKERLEEHNIYIHDLPHMRFNITERALEVIPILRDRVEGTLDREVHIVFVDSISLGTHNILQHSNDLPDIISIIKYLREIDIDSVSGIIGGIYIDRESKNLDGSENLPKFKGKGIYIFIAAGDDIANKSGYNFDPKALRRGIPYILGNAGIVLITHHELLHYMDHDNRMHPRIRNNGIETLVDYRAIGIYEKYPELISFTIMPKYKPNTTNHGKLDPRKKRTSGM